MSEPESPAKGASRPIRARERWLALLPLVVFGVVGVAVSLLRHRAWYLVLFGGLGVLLSATTELHRRLGRRALCLRVGLNVAVGAFFVLYLMGVLRINFQFSQVVFDAMTGVVTGALIQLVVSRLALPLFFGNGFCSAVCWDGAVFEFLPVRGKRRLPAWTTYLPYVYLVATAAAALLLYRHGINPSEDASLRGSWVLAENGLILFVGIAASPWFGSRTYCRALCPFRAISRLFSRYSMVKMGGRTGERCLRCRKCSDACPMEIPVHRYVAAGERVRSGECLLCERCAAACEAGLLGVSVDAPWK